MRGYLSLIVDSDHFEDNAEPGFLVNPLTGERLQLDRYYPPNVAFEFNGPQHYRATPKYTAEQVARQRARDLMKIGICFDKEVDLVIIHPADLSLRSMQQKVSGLPLRDLRGFEPAVDFLKKVSGPYRRAARRERF